MKKTLLSLALLLFGITSVKYVHAQGTNACTLGVSDVVVSIVGDPVTVSATQCKITFNVSFNLQYNSGNTFIYIHSFLESNYTPSFDCSKNGAANPPTALTLGTVADAAGKFSFFDLGLNNNVARGAIGVPVSVPILTSYGPDATVVLTQPSNSPGLTVTKTATATTNIDRFTITNATVIVNQSCATSLVVKTDIWSSNANTSTAKAQCFTCANQITSTFNNPTISGNIVCGSPRTYNLNISTTKTTNQQINYNVYIDNNDNGTLETETDILVFTSATLNINSSSSLALSNQGYLPYSNQIAYASKNLLVALTSPDFANSRLQILKPDPAIDCAPLVVLPVSFKSFFATRNNQNVSLKWETASEQNNKGFYVQRSLPNGTWQDVAFVFSQAEHGNSSTALSYSLNDLNINKGISQYRLLQVDIDGHGKYSEVRSVRGEEMAARLLVFPNPSSTGTINILFDDASAPKDVMVSDLAGRLVKQYSNVSGSLEVKKLKSGFYTIRVLNRSTGAALVEKVIVNER